MVRRIKLIKAHQFFIGDMLLAVIFHDDTILFLTSFCVANFTSGWDIRSSHQRCSVKKGLLGNFAKFAGKHLCQSLFFNKVTGLTAFKNLKGYGLPKAFT